MASNRTLDCTSGADICPLSESFVTVRPGQRLAGATPNFIRELEQETVLKMKRVECIEISLL